MSDKFESFLTEDHPVPGRLDKVLAGIIEDMSRARVQALIVDGHAKINGYPAKSGSAKVKVGDHVALEIPEPVASEPQAEDIPLDIVYEDDDMLVINKVAGMVVHPGAGNHSGTLVNALLHHCRDSLSGIGGVLRPGIVHRLDKETSGLMVAAKHDKAHKGLSAQLQDRSLSREYTALVLKVPTPIKGFVEGSIGRDPRNRLRMAYNPKGGKAARTFYHVVKSFQAGASMVQCKLESGRTHQIRVHMQAMGHCLIGDKLYGAQPTAVRSALSKAGYEDSVIDACLSFPRQALHAQKIAFVHPMSGEAMEFSCDYPADLAELFGVFEK